MAELANASPTKDTPINTAPQASNLVMAYKHFIEVDGTYFSRVTCLPSIK